MQVTLEDLAADRTVVKEGKLLVSACCVAEQLFSRVMAVGKKLLLCLDVLAHRPDNVCQRGGAQRDV